MEGARQERRLLAVVMPILDDGRHVSRLLNYWSIFLKECQFSNEVTFILVDQSQDDLVVAPLAEGLAKAGFDVHLDRHSGPIGPGAARQFGMQYADTEYVCFFDVDDWPELAGFVAAARWAHQESLDVVAVDYLIMSTSGVVERGKVPRTDYFWEDLLLHRVGVWRFVFRNQWLRDVGIEFPCWDYAEDLVFLMECAQNAPRTGYLDTLGYRYSMHSAGLSGKRPRSAQVGRALKWLRRNALGSPVASVRFLGAIWTAKFALLLGAAAGPAVLASLPTLARHPIVVSRLLVVAARRRARRSGLIFPTLPKILRR